MNVKAAQRRKSLRKFQERFRSSNKHFLNTNPALRFRLGSSSWSSKSSKDVKQKLEIDNYSLQLALFDIGWADSTQHAKNKILSGKVFVNGFRTKNNKAKLNVLDIVRCESNVEIKKHQYKTASATRFVIDSLTLTAIFVGKF